MKFESEFPRSGPYKGNGNTYRRSICQKCLNRRNWKIKRIPLGTVRPHLLEILNRTGSQRRAAQALEITPTQLRHWLGLAYRYHPDGRKTKATSISRKSATLILTTLRQLRSENVHYEHGNRSGKKPYWFNVNDQEAERGRHRRTT